MTIFHYAFLNFTLLDLMDVLLVAALIYSILRILQGSRALQMIGGLAIILVLVVIAYWLQLSTLRWLVSRLATVWLIAFIILFQPELRSILTAVGNNPLFRPFIREESKLVLEILMKALQKLKDTRTGALIVIRRETGMKEIIANGKPIGAELSSELLVTIFAPHTPLHDGAVVIIGNRIEAAACQLPLTHNPRYQESLGMRHRAAVGISEVTDAVAIVVSEETGALSIALRGHLRQDLATEVVEKLLRITLRKRRR